MKKFKLLIITMLMLSYFCMGGRALADGQWQTYTFGPPNGGLLVFTLSDGNAACASYNGRDCLWGTPINEIDFRRLKPLTCGARHRAIWGVTGYEDPNHWCNLALELRR